MKFIDSSIWLDHFAETSKNSIAIIESSEVVQCSILSLYEVEKRLIKLKVTPEEIERALQFIKLRGIIINLNEDILSQAVNFSVKYNLSAIDALIYATAMEQNSILITADNNFRGLPNTEIIDK